MPVRLIAQELGASVDWDGIGRAVTVLKSQNEIVLTIDSGSAFVNGIEATLDYPAIIYKDSTYVPLRYITENLDATVGYSLRLSLEFTYYYDTLMPVYQEKNMRVLFKAEYSLEVCAKRTTSLMCP